MPVEIPQLKNRLLTSYTFITDELVHTCEVSLIKVTNKIYMVTIKIQIENNMQPGYRFA